MRTLARVIASGLGSGYSPKAPGTAGSLLALIFGAWMLTGPAWVLWLAIIAAVLLGLWAIGPAGGTEDPGWVVIDEFAGQWIALLPLGHFSWTGLLAAFALFRLFDITKPGPVGWADRQHGAFGVMADDIIAGAMAAIVIFALRMALPTWF